RADSGAVRQGSERAVVEGRWIIAADGPVPERVRDAGGDVDPFGDGSRGELIVTRQLSSEGRSRASVGGRGAPAALLTEIGEQLVVVHGQSDQMRLRSSTAQRQALDRFAGSALAPVLGEYQEVFRRWHSARAELDRLVTEQDARTREAEELRAAIDAIEAVAPQPGEDEELRERIDRLTNLEDLRAAASAAHELMSSEDASGEMADAASVLDTAHRRLDRVAAHDPGLAEIIESLDSARILVAEIAVQLSGYLAGLDADGARELETLQDRRAELAALTRAHGPTVEDALAFLDTGSARLLELDGDTDRIDLLRVEVERDERLVGELAARV
ncbi:DNA repair protein RecN, partial [Clavibacter nebraskensis]